MGNTYNNFLFICYDVDGGYIRDNFPAMGDGASFLNDYIDNIIEIN